MSKKESNELGDSLLKVTMDYIEKASKKEGYDPLAEEITYRLTKIATDTLDEMKLDTDKKVVKRAKISISMVKCIIDILESMIPKKDKIYKKYMSYLGLLEMITKKGKPVIDFINQEQGEDYLIKMFKDINRDFIYLVDECHRGCKEDSPERTRSEQVNKK